MRENEFDTQEEAHRFFVDYYTKQGFVENKRGVLHGYTSKSKGNSSAKVVNYHDKTMRIYQNDGQNITTDVVNIVDGKRYLISTAKDLHGWQLAVFEVEFTVSGVNTDLKPLRIGFFTTFDEAEKKHFETERLVTRFPREEWQNYD